MLRKSFNLAPASLLCVNLNALCLAIGLAGVDLLAGLLDGAQDSLVFERGLGDDGGDLGVKRDVVGFYACEERGGC
jgi:hypothetical protein